MLSLTVVSDSLWPHELTPWARFVCPWDFPGKITRVGCHALLQGILPTQGSNLHLLHWQVSSLPLSHLGSRVSGNTHICRVRNSRGGAQKSAPYFLQVIPMHTQVLELLLWRDTAARALRDTGYSLFSREDIDLYKCGETPRQGLLQPLWVPWAATWLACP